MLSDINITALNCCTNFVKNNIIALYLINTCIACANSSFKKNMGHLYTKMENWKIDNFFNSRYFLLSFCCCFIETLYS